jgi:hypothetical protein
MEFITDVELLLLLSQEELFEELGKQMIPSSLGFWDIATEKLVEVGENWLNENRTKLQEKICCSITLQYYLRFPDKYDQVIVIAVITDFIADLIIGVAPLTVAVLIFKQGINVFCKKKMLDMYR